MFMHSYARMRVVVSFVLGFSLLVALRPAILVAEPDPEAGVSSDASVETVSAQAYTHAVGPYGSGFLRLHRVTSQFALYVGGHIKADLIWDSQQLDSDLPFYALPRQVAGDAGQLVDNPADAVRSVNLAARELLLLLGGNTPAYGDWSVSWYIETNFLGFLPRGAGPGSPTPVLRHGFATVQNGRTGTSLRFGQAEGPFAPLDALTLNWETLVLMGNPFSRLPQIRLGQTAGPVLFEAAVVRPADASNDTLRGYDYVGRGQDAGMPELQGRVSWTFGGTGRYWFFETPGSVGVSGRYAREAFAAGTADEKVFPSWTAALDLVLPLGPLTLTGEAFYGHNSDNVYGLGGVRGVRTAEGFAPQAAIAEWGGWIQLGYQPVEPVQLSVSYGTLRPETSGWAEPDGAQASGSDLLTNQAVTSTAYWRFLPTTFVALEHTWLQSTHWIRLDGDTRGVAVDGDLHRLQLGLLHSF